MIPRTVMRGFLAEYKAETGAEFDEETLSAYLTARIYESLKAQGLVSQTMAACSVIEEYLDEEPIDIGKNNDGLVLVQSVYKRAANVNDQFPVQDALIRFAEKVL